MRNKQWTKGTSVTLRPHRTGDERLWWLHSLYLNINRHCEEFWDDDEVSQALNEMAERTPLPFDY